MGLSIWHIITFVLLIGIFSPLFWNPNVIYVFEAQVFIAAGMAVWGMLMFFQMKTPVTSFLDALSGNKILLFNPKDNKYVEFLPSKKQGGLSYSKKRGFYQINPNDVYIESKSKVPIALVYDNYAISIDIDTVELVEELRKYGYTSYKDLADHYNQYIFSLRNYATAKEEWEKDDSKEKPEFTMAEPKPPTIEIKGKTFNLSDVIMFFANNERSDLIEAEIQWRTSAISQKKSGGPIDMKWAVFIVIILVGAAIAYGMITSGGGGGGIDTNAITKAIQDATGIAKVVTTTTTIPTGTSLS